VHILLRWVPQIIPLGQMLVPRIILRSLRFRTCVSQMASAQRSWIRVARKAAITRPVASQHAAAALAPRIMWMAVPTRRHHRRRLRPIPLGKWQPQIVPQIIRLGQLLAPRIILRSHKGCTVAAQITGLALTSVASTNALAQAA